MDNPLTPINQKALRTLGELVRSWSIPGTLPEHARVDDHTYCLSRETFEQMLSEKGLKPGEDYELRPNIEEVELIVRRENVFTVALPEPWTSTSRDTRDDTDSDPSYTIELPVIYENIDPATVIGAADTDPATVKVQVDNSDLDAFLDPYVATYVCTQCR